MTLTLTLTLDLPIGRVPKNRNRVIYSSDEDEDKDDVDFDDCPTSDSMKAYFDKYLKSSNTTINISVISDKYVAENEQKGIH